VPCYDDWPVYEEHYITESMMRYYIKKLWFIFFHRSPYAGIGRFLFPLFSKRVANIQSEFFVATGENFIDGCLRAEINYRYYEQPDDAIQSENRKRFWGASHSKQWHDHHESQALMHYDERMKFKIPLVSWIAKHAQRKKISTVCEVGTGMGHFLFILREHLVKVMTCRFIGFDLNDECIQEAKRRNSFEDTKFYCGDAKIYISEKAQRNTLYIFVGTLEYFTQNELENVLKTIAQQRPSIIAISDSINLDRRVDFDSKPRGNIAFSHNYEYLLKKHGYTILEKKIVPINPEIKFYEGVMLLAEMS